MEPIVIWDLDDDPEGNAAHIAEHGVTKEEVQEVLQTKTTRRMPVHRAAGRLPLAGPVRASIWRGCGKRLATIPGWSTRSRLTKRLHGQGETMAKSVQHKTERSPEEVARLRELRDRYQREKPSIADLEAQGAQFTTLGEVVLLRCLADDLRQERERQGLTREQLAERLNMSSEKLGGIETGAVAQLTLGVLARIAHALGKQIACSLVEKVA